VSTVKVIHPVLTMVQECGCMQDPGYTKIVHGATRGAQVKVDFLGWITSSGGEWLAVC
jgi:hypothetical protein